MASQRVDHAATRLGQQHPAHRLRDAQETVRRLATGLDRSLRQQLDRQRLRVQALGRELEAVSPLAVLNRGFAVASDGQGQILRSVKHVAPGDLLNLRLVDGQVATRVESTDSNGD